jgi:predicted nucleic-acid-binding Zn-ribbon protein
MNSIKCYQCGGHEFTAVEFRETPTNHIEVGHEAVDLICQKCGYVMYEILGRAEKVQKPYRIKQRFQDWLKRWQRNRKDKYYVDI